MELVTLHPFSTNLSNIKASFQPARLVEGHSSLLWTERYNTNGDFQRTSYDISGTLNQLPLYTLAGDGVTQIPTIVSLRDSTVPMIVETHTLGVDNDNAMVITTVGRSVETVLDRRSTVAKPFGAGTVISAYEADPLTAVDFAYDVMKRVVNDGIASAADIFPELDVLTSGNGGIIRPSGYTPPATTTHMVADLGELYSWLIQQVQNDGYGFRAVRPSDRTKNKIALQIYKGTDRTQKVVFDTLQNAFDSQQYLLSQQVWKNVDQVNAKNDALEVSQPGGTYSGMMRRVNYQDAQETTASIPAGTNLNQAMTNLGLVDLAKNTPTVLFSGEVSRQIAAAYGDAVNGYLLGDIVGLRGQISPQGANSLTQFVRISEFIRSEDNTGEKAYPTFESL